MKLRGESGAVPARGGGGIAGGISVRSKSVDTGTKRMVTKQNRAAESYKIKDLDKLEKGRAARAERKLKDADAKAKQLKKAELTGLVKGAAATAAVGAAAKLTVAAKDKKKKTSTKKK